MENGKPAKKKEAGGKPEFKGRISSISCPNDVAELRFEVDNKKGEGHMFVEQAGNGAMVKLITAAYMAGKKVTDVDAVAGEIRLGAKMKPTRVQAERSCKVNMEKPVKMKAETSAKVKTEKPARVNTKEPAQTLDGPVLEASPPDLSQRSDQENRL